MSRPPKTLSLLLAPVLVACSPAERQAPVNAVDSSAPSPVTVDDYRRAESRLRANTDPLVTGRIIEHWWQEDERLIYRRSTAEGSEYLVVDPAQLSRARLMDSRTLASALAKYGEEAADATDPDIDALALEGDELRFEFDGKPYAQSMASGALRQLADAPEHEHRSPDGRRAAFIRDHNLWLRDTATDELTQLTFDGEAHYGYATNNAGWLRDEAPVLKWSDDSDRIATFRHDGRRVRDMALWSTRVGHPEIDVWKYPLPGDEHIFMIERVVIHLEPQPKLVRLQRPADAHRSTSRDHVAAGDEFLDVQWTDEGRGLAFVSSSRDHKVATLRTADIDSGEVSDIYEETVATHYQGGFSAANWRVLPNSGEFIWFSESSGWGHLYLGDLESGAIKRAITSGRWPVLDVVKVDEQSRLIYFTAANREGGDPYYQYLYRVSPDGGEPELLTPGEGNHRLSWSDSQAYFIDYRSSPQNPGRYVLRNSDGAELMRLEQPDITRLSATGWQPAESFTVKARDQLTELHGLLYKPGNFDPSAQYPVLNYLYPGPQTGSVGSRSFLSARGDKQAVAELGFVVVELDAMGTPGRSKSFHDACYGNMGDNGLPDQIAGIRQLAETRPWMDLDRVGIWGHSGGGFASTAGILRYPDFYKVAVSGAGNHDNRNYEDDWGERWQGLLETFPETGVTAGKESRAGAQTNYDNQANPLLADRLEGKLLLAHGMMDSNMHPSNTLLMVEALIDAEKDFDVLVLPNAGHDFGNRRYFMKRRWDYFVEHLLGSRPPADFRFADNID